MIAVIGDVAGQPCIDEREFCQGAVLYREPLSGTGVSYPRCERRLDRERQLRQRYPQRPPVDRSPLDAGERGTKTKTTEALAPTANTGYQRRSWCWVLGLGERGEGAPAVSLGVTEPSATNSPENPCAAPPARKSALTSPGVSRVSWASHAFTAGAAAATSPRGSWVTRWAWGAVGAARCPHFGAGGALVGGLCTPGPSGQRSSWVGAVTGHRSGKRWCRVGVRDGGGVRMPPAGPGSR